ncbi:hypothetical protein HMI56_001047 [Coelomomyces lativittatus]|nr:hypothetical protein HMI56_001047 [Coelomomyces lativittatus]
MVKCNGLVFHDITNLYHGRKAVSAGVDGLIAVCGGAGGHAGLLSPCAFLPMLRAAFPKLPIVVGGGISDGRMVRAMQVGGADLSYLGTRFIATQEANASAKYKAMLVHTKQVDGPELPIVYTNRVSGVYANFLKDSLVQAGLDPKRLVDMKPVEEDFSKLDSEAKAWKDIWSAGHGTLNIHDIPTVEALVKRLSMEYFQAMEMEVKDIALWKEKSKL